MVTLYGALVDEAVDDALCGDQLTPDVHDLVDHVLRHYATSACAGALECEDPDPGLVESALASLGPVLGWDRAATAAWLGRVIRGARLGLGEG